MVSISSNTGIGSTFGDPIDDQSLANVSTQNLLPVHVSLYSSKDLVKKLPCGWLVVLYILLLISFESLSFILNDVLHVKLLGGIDEPFALFTAMNVAMWAFTYLYDRCLHFNHNLLRRFGYLSFVIKTNDLRKIPLAIFSLGNATLLLVVAFTRSSTKTGLSLVRQYQIVASIEVFVSFISCIIYLAYVISFNKAGALPDAYQQDCTKDNSTSYVGYKDSNDTDDILEKQSEMIRYLQQHNEHLNKTIISLSTRLTKSEPQ